MKSFWTDLARPFFVLAPMADVTDPALRRIIAEIQPPAVTWTEFVSADGLFHTRRKREDGTAVYGSDADNPLMRDLQFSDTEHPIVAQIFGSNPDTIAYASELALKLGFDGVDINMGCPDKTIEKQGAGAAMIKSPEIAKQVIAAARRGVANSIPVSVKTRIGFNTNELETWIPMLLEERLDALTVHLRTRKEMSAVPAHWELMPRIVELRDSISPETRILGNGDVKDMEDARKKAEETGADGIMLGRAIFGNPWLFTGKRSEDIPPEDKLQMLVKLAYAFEEMRPQKSFHILKKHIKAFAIGFDGAAELRAKLMETETAEELEKVIGDNPVVGVEEGGMMA